ncbi:hypothetical protein Cadr_000016447 [Camelus dromedarius]|uniref:Uncharacterized protein n=1 Tax=Camelus dromedarius TaxID=9838 RepID=A0A5N4E9I1_CAMDR|nr:hypothetical protein Cadr_000016447 [Camelus dromedarius]
MCLSGLRAGSLGGPEWGPLISPKSAARVWEASANGGQSKSQGSGGGGGWVGSPGLTGMQAAVSPPAKPVSILPRSNIQRPWAPAMRAREHDAELPAQEVIEDHGTEAPGCRAQGEHGLYVWAPGSSYVPSEPRDSCFSRLPQMAVSLLSPVVCKQHGDNHVSGMPQWESSPGEKVGPCV